MVFQAVEGWASVVFISTKGHEGLRFLPSEERRVSPKLKCDSPDPNTGGPIGIVRINPYNRRKTHRWSNHQETISKPWFDKLTMGGANITQG